MSPGVSQDPTCRDQLPAKLATTARTPANTCADTEGLSSTSYSSYPSLDNLRPPLLSLLYSVLYCSGLAESTGEHLKQCTLVTSVRSTAGPCLSPTSHLTPDVLTGRDADSIQGVRDPKRRLEDGEGSARRPSATGQGRQEQVESLTSSSVQGFGMADRQPGVVRHAARTRARELYAPRISV